MDFEQLDTNAASEHGVEVQLRHPGTDDPLDAFVTGYGQDSAQYRKAMSERARKWARIIKKGTRDLTPEEMRQGGIDLMADITSSWRGIELDGQVIECNPENARKFYARFYWAAEQLDAKVHDRANFLPASSTN